MLANCHSQRGVTLIELLVGMVIVVILLFMGMPSFSVWLQNSQIRTAAESIQNGLQLARTEAVRRNATVRFDLTDAGGAASWSVGCVSVTANCPYPIQSKSSAEGTKNAGVGISKVAPPSPVPVTQYDSALAAGTDLPAGVSFNSFGGVLVANIGADITRIDITNVASPTARRLVTIVSSGGLIRLCDPAISIASNPQGCS